MTRAMVMMHFYVLIVLFYSFQNKTETTYSLTVNAKGLRNSDGVVQFALYNKEGSIPDAHYKKYYRKLTAKIVNGTSEVTFLNIPIGNYAINILHDEDVDGKIKKGIILPKEGIGFSNYQSIGLLNKPEFGKASFNLTSDKTLDVKIIYL
ncbi:MAG: DUF2141 domain-containing protein [Salinivirgaceae bacterium]|jgi:uncharacterized protein (DUF2141 family)|nr:DUF2141 domain-containing protein [Salinivirgaceae bacterium]